MLGQRLRAARKRKKMTLEEVARKLNTSHTTISRYEQEKRKPDPGALRAFCELYDVSADYLLGLSQNMPYPDE